MGKNVGILSQGCLWGEYILILVSLGTQDFPFDRLLKEIDLLIEKGVIKDEVYAQVGYSPYRAKHFHCEEFTSFNDFDRLLDSCNLLITHGGTGTIVGALKKGKKVIAVPRLVKFHEHVDDHQKEIIDLFSEKNLIVGLKEVSELETAMQRIDSFEPKEFVSGNQKILGLIDDFIKSL
jgi:UDP-N-acetylglucosamine transferase subunit ALG13